MISFGLGYFQLSQGYFQLWSHLCFSLGLKCMLQPIFLNSLVRFEPIFTYRSCMPRSIAVDHMTSGNFLPNICVWQFLLYQKYVKTGYSWSHTQLLSLGFQQSQNIGAFREYCLYKSWLLKCFLKKIIYFSTVVTRIDLDFLTILLGTLTFLPNILLLQFLNI